jgi:hypothetical protein
MVQLEFTTTRRGTTFEPAYTLDAKDATSNKKLEEFYRVRNSDEAPVSWLKVYEDGGDKYIRVAFGVTAEKIKVGKVWKRISKGDEKKSIRDHVKAVKFLFEEVREKYKSTSYKEIRIETTSFSLNKNNTGERIEGYDESAAPEGLDRELFLGITDAILVALEETGQFDGSSELSSHLTYRLKPESPVQVRPSK